jgi:hypothetical protein
MRSPGQASTYLPAVIPTGEILSLISTGIRAVSNAHRTVLAALPVETLVHLFALYTLARGRYLTFNAACSNARAMAPERLIEIMASREDFCERLRTILKAHGASRTLADILSPACFIEAARESDNEFDLFGPELTHRESRTPAEGPYSPDWRFWQTERYLSYLRRPTSTRVTLREFMLGEDDQETLGLYSFRAGLRTSKDPAYDFALRAYADREWGIGAVIKAMALADFSIEEIAMGFGMPADRIQTFVNVFWDLTPLPRDSAWMRMLLTPNDGWDESSVAAMSAGVLMTAALELGQTGVAQMLTGLAEGEEERVGLINCFVERGRRDAEMTPLLERFFPIPLEVELFYEGVTAISAGSVQAPDHPRNQAFRQTLRRIGQGEHLHQFLPWVRTRGETSAEAPAASPN